MSTPALEQAIHSLRNGDRAAAQTLLLQLTAEQPALAEGWLWLAAVSEDATQKRSHLQQALALNPQDPRAAAALRALGDAPQPAPLTEMPAEPAQPAQALPLVEVPKLKLPSIDPLAQPRFVTTGVQSRHVPWTLIALICAIVVLIPLTLWLI